MHRAHLHIIVLETQRKLARRIEAFLIASGYLVTLVRSPAALIQALGKNNPAVAILDILNPTVSEVHALRALPGMAGSLAMVLIARSHKGKQRSTTIFEAQTEEWKIVVHDVESLPGAIEKCEQHILASQRVLRVGRADTMLNTEDCSLTTVTGYYHLKPAICATLEYLMRRYPRAIPEKELRANVVRFAHDASTQAVYTRIYELRQALEAYGADIDIETSGGYRVVILAEPHNSRQKEPTQKRKNPKRNDSTQNVQL